MTDHPRKDEGFEDQRRAFLKLLGVAGAGSLAGCGGGGPAATTEGDGEADGGAGDGGMDGTGDGTDGGAGDTEAAGGDGTDGETAAAGGDVEQFFADAAADYEGQTITLVTESTPPSLWYQNNQVSNFEEITGISVDFQAVSFTEMSNRIVSNATSGQAGLDIAYTEQDSLAAYAANEWLIDHTAFGEENSNLSWSGFDVDDFVPFAENFRYPDADSPYYAFPMESFLKLIIYRQDVYENEEMSAAYQDEHGEEFTVPENPDQYMRAAQFISENSGDILGQQLAGHAAQVQGVTGPYAMVETYFPIHGVYNWGIDQDDMTALASRNGTMNSDAAIEAFQWYRDLLDYAPDGVQSYTWSGPPDAIIAGDAAQGTVYSENLGNMVGGDDLAYDPSDLGVALPPVREGVIEDAESGEGYVGYFDGGGYGVMQASQRKEPAYLFLQWLLRPEAQRGLAEEVGAITRNSAIEAARGTQINEATGYVDFFEEYNDLFQGNPNGRVQQVLINQVFQSPFQEFVAGNISAEQCANRWAYNTEQTLVELGFLDQSGEQPSPM
jgi:multiple sugar transport system substrate-binding protein